MKETSKRKTINRLRIGVLLATILVIVGYFTTANIKIDTKSETVEVGTAYVDSKQTATLFGANVSFLVEKQGEVDTNSVGKYIITYKTFFNKEEYQKVIEVVDTKLPQIELIGEKIVYVSDIESYNEPGVKATDNYDGDISKSVTTKILQIDNNNYEVEYTVFDSSGNKASIKRSIKKYDGIVYLTFDDGPSNNNTPEILNILQEKGVTATFFVIGYDESKTEIINRMLDEGHTIGLHGMSHTYSEIYTSQDAIMNNFYKIEELVKQTTNGYVSKYIRFPGGSSNTVSKKYCKGVMTDAVKRATEEGYKYFDWNVDSMDAGGAKNSEEIYQNVISGIKSSRTNIVLMHDASDKTNTVEALPKIIDYCLENNFLVKAIDNETVEVHHGISN